MAVSYTSEVPFGTNHPGLGLSTSWLATHNNLFATEAIARQVLRYLGSSLPPCATCGARRSTVANVDIGMVSGLNTSKDRDGTWIVGRKIFRKLSQGFTSTPWDSLQCRYRLSWNAWLGCRVWPSFKARGSHDFPNRRNSLAQFLRKVVAWFAFVAVPRRPLCTDPSGRLTVDSVRDPGFQERRWVATWCGCRERRGQVTGCIGVALGGGLVHSIAGHAYSPSFPGAGLFIRGPRMPLVRVPRLGC